MINGRIIHKTGQSEIDTGIGRIRHMRYDAGVIPLPASCPALTLTGSPSIDDFNRPDNATPTALGANWVPYSGVAAGRAQNPAWWSILSNQARTAPDPPLVATTDRFPYTVAGQFTPFPNTTKDQQIQCTFGGSSLVATGGPANSGFGGDITIAGRFTNVDANFFYASGAGGGGTKSSWVGYYARYHESYNADGSFASAFVGIGRHELTGNVEPSGGFVGKMNPGDVFSLTCANFISGGQEVVCVKGFINGVQIGVTFVDSSGPIPPNQFGRVLTGGAGLFNEAYRSDPLNNANYVQFFVDDFQAQACLPNPV